jgi:formyl-CoA transferase
MAGPLAGVRIVEVWLAPALGEHTEAVLAELGYDAGAIAALRAEGVIP